MPRGSLPLANVQIDTYIPAWRVGHDDACKTSGDPDDRCPRRFRARSGRHASSFGAGRAAHPHRRQPGAALGLRVGFSRRTPNAAVISSSVEEFARYKLSEEHFREWLKGGLTGCRFAKMLAKKRPRIRVDFYSPFGLFDHDEAAAFIDGTVARDVVAILLFPAIRTAAATADLLLHLSKSERWKVVAEPWRSGFEKADALPFGLRWKTSTDCIECDAMGLGPIGTMPVTRRAPYVAIVIWGGPHKNDHVKKGPRVGVASAPTDLDPKKHDRMMKLSDARVRALLGVEPPEHAAWLRRIGFILPISSSKRLQRGLPSLPQATIYAPAQ